MQLTGKVLFSGMYIHDISGALPFISRKTQSMELYFNSLYAFLTGCPFIICWYNYRYHFSIRSQVKIIMHTGNALDVELLSICAGSSWTLLEFIVVCENCRYIIQSLEEMNIIIEYLPEFRYIAGRPLEDYMIMPQEWQARRSQHTTAWKTHPNRCTLPWIRHESVKNYILPTFFHHTFYVEIIRWKYTIWESPTQNPFYLRMFIWKFHEIVHSFSRRLLSHGQHNYLIIIDIDRSLNLFRLSASRLKNSLSIPLGISVDDISGSIASISFWHGTDILWCDRTSCRHGIITIYCPTESEISLLTRVWNALSIP